MAVTPGKRFRTPLFVGNLPIKSIRYFSFPEVTNTIFKMIVGEKRLIKKIMHYMIVNDFWPRRNRLFMCKIDRAKSGWNFKIAPLLVFQITRLPISFLDKSIMIKLVWNEMFFFDNNSIWHKISYECTCDELAWTVQ